MKKNFFKKLYCFPWKPKKAILEIIGRWYYVNYNMDLHVIECIHSDKFYYYHIYCRAIFPYEIIGKHVVDDGKFSTLCKCISFIMEDIERSFCKLITYKDRTDIKFSETPFSVLKGYNIGKWMGQRENLFYYITCFEYEKNYIYLVTRKSIINCLRKSFKTIKEAIKYIGGENAEQ